MKVSRVLSDHKRVGKRFIPPMMQIPNLHLSAYANDRLAQVIWIAALMHRCDPDIDFELSGQIARSAWEACCEKLPEFACASGYTKLTAIQQQRVVELLTDVGSISDIAPKLSPIANCYPSFPLAFLCEPIKSPRRSDISFCRNVVSAIFDRSTRDATLALSAMMAIALESGHTLFMEGVHIPDLNQVIDYPRTEESREAAAFIRAMSGYITAFNEDLVAPWNAQFWIEGRRLSLCQ